MVNLILHVILLTRQLSRAPEGHWSRTPGSPLAERWFQEFQLNCRVLPERSEGRTAACSAARKEGRPTKTMTTCRTTPKRRACRRRLQHVVRHGFPCECDVFDSMPFMLVLTNGASLTVTPSLSLRSHARHVAHRLDVLD